MGCKLAPLTGTKEVIEAIRAEYWGSCQYQITDSAYGSQMGITGYLTIDWEKYIRGNSLIRCLDPYDGHASDINCNFPDISSLFANLIDLDLPVEELIPFVPVGDYGLPTSGHIPLAIELSGTSAEALIDSYGQNYFIDDALPDWYRDAIDNPPPLEIFQTGIGNTGTGDKTPKIIESLPICKEQDPSVVNYGKSPLATVLGK